MDPLHHITLPAALDHLGGLTGPVLECARTKGLDEKVITRIDLAMEEVLVNIIKYSYTASENSGDITVSCGLSGSAGNRMFMIEIRDTGIPFDVTQKDPPDVEAAIDDRQIGGLGIYLVKKTMDLVDYQRQGDTNVLLLGIRMPNADETERL
ncbi:MAG: ATP-binding protein [Thermodesulfobacteriota bacterium]|nr:ATP-binding protein [Thermodesulfobacteriota bacterium]